MRKAFHCGRLYLGREGDTNFDQFIDKLTPIELPSDEEIYEMSKEFIKYNSHKRAWFSEGLKFMRDKIQGGKSNATDNHIQRHQGH